MSLPWWWVSQKERTKCHCKLAVSTSLWYSITLQHREAKVTPLSFCYILLVHKNMLWPQFAVDAAGGGERGRENDCRQFLQSPCFLLDFKAVFNYSGPGYSLVIGHLENWVSLFGTALHSFRTYITGRQVYVSLGDQVSERFDGDNGTAVTQFHTL